MMCLECFEHRKYDFQSYLFYFEDLAKYLGYSVPLRAWEIETHFTLVVGLPDLRSSRAKRGIFLGSFLSKITKFATKNSYETRSKLCPKLIMQHKKCNIFNSSRNNSLWRALCGKPKHIHWFSIYLATQSVNFSVHRFSVYLTIQSMRFYIHRFRFTSHWDRFSVYLTTQSSNCLNLFTHFGLPLARHQVSAFYSPIFGLPHDTKFKRITISIMVNKNFVKRIIIKIMVNRNFM